MIWPAVGGILAGLALGFLGAGGTVVGLPFALYLARLDPHVALGSNALGVSFIAIALLAFRIWQHKVHLREVTFFTILGLVGIRIGALIGLAYPGNRLVFLLGIILFLASGWFIFLSLQPEKKAPSPASAQNSETKSIWKISLTGLVVGIVAGFFAIGGGFIIVPALVIAGGLELSEAASSGLLPIALFSGWIGVQYLLAHAIDTSFSFQMLFPGLMGGALGIWLSTKLSKQTTQRVFAVFLACLGIYMLL
jgi:uncharacterized membrane protein YfcA